MKKVKSFEDPVLAVLSVVFPFCQAGSYTPAGGQVLGMINNYIILVRLNDTFTGFNFTLMLYVVKDLVRMIVLAIFETDS